MRETFLLVVIAVSIISPLNNAFSLESIILEQRNEYGGRTEQETYSSEDDTYKAGLVKLVQYFDGNDRIIKLETFFNDRHALTDGVERSVQYFDNRFYRTGIRTRVEFYYTDSYAGIEGLAKAIQHYDEAEKRTKIDYFYTDAYAKKHQTARLEVLYDPKGNLVKRTYFDKDGKVLSRENRR